MKKTKSAILIIAFIAMGSAPVAGEDYWAGAHAGIQLGFASSDFEDLAAIFDGDDSDDGFVAGISVGYNWSLNNGWYIGPELQFDIEDLSINDPDTGGSLAYDAIVRLKLVAGREIADGRGLLFGSLGVAYSGLDAVDEFVADIDDSQTDWMVGIGYDHRLGQSDWTLGGEYIYHNFDDFDYDLVQLRLQYRF